MKVESKFSFKILLFHVIGERLRGPMLFLFRPFCLLGTGSQMSHMWVKHCYKWVTDESHCSYTLEYSISHLLQTYHALTPL